MTCYLPCFRLRNEVDFLVSTLGYYVLAVSVGLFAHLHSYTLTAVYQTLWHLQDRDEMKGRRLPRAVILIENGSVNRLLNVQAREQEIGRLSVCLGLLAPFRQFL